jgi:uncharacterized protein (DUF3084 family)
MMLTGVSVKSKRSKERASASRDIVKPIGDKMSERMDMTKTGEEMVQSLDKTIDENNKSIGEARSNIRAQEQRIQALMSHSKKCEESKIEMKRIWASVSATVDQAVNP